MANALRDKGREGFLDGNIDWDTNTIKLFLYDEGADAFNAADDNLDDILAGARIATSGALTTKTVTDGVADADDVTLSLVSGASVESIELYKDSGVESTSRLIANIDTATGLPVTPNGGDIIIVWDAGANRIFKL
jgi:hypothetical protein